MLLIVFGLSWFFHTPIPATTLQGIENVITDCTNPYNTQDKTKDGVIPWNCSLNFTSLGVQMETVPSRSKMTSFFSFINRENLTTSTTHLPWAYLRFSTAVSYSGVNGRADAGTYKTPPHKELEPQYWVHTELRKLPEWATEYFQQKNTKENDSKISFKAETTRSFTHIVVPKGFGDNTTLVIWFTLVFVMVCTSGLAFLYRGYTLYRVSRNLEVRLVEVSVVWQCVLLACEIAAFVFISVGAIWMVVLFCDHRDEAMIGASTVEHWQRVRLIFRVGLIFCSFRAVSFFTEMPKPHHFARMNAVVFGLGLGFLLVGLIRVPVSRVNLVVSLASLVSGAIDVSVSLTLLAVVGAGALFRSPPTSVEVRQAHFDNLRSDLGLGLLQGQSGEVEGEGDGSDHAVVHVEEGSTSHDSSSSVSTRDVASTDGDPATRDHTAAQSGDTAERSSGLSLPRGNPLVSPLLSVSLAAGQNSASLIADESEAHQSLGASLPELRIRSDRDSDGGSDGSESVATPCTIVLAEGVSLSTRSYQPSPSSSDSIAPSDSSCHMTVLISMDALADRRVAFPETPTREYTESEQDSPDPKVSSVTHSPPSAASPPLPEPDMQVPASRHTPRVSLCAPRQFEGVVIALSTLGHFLLFVVAASLLLRPFLALDAPRGVIPVTGEAYLTTDFRALDFIGRFFN